MNYGKRCLGAGECHFNLIDLLCTVFSNVFEGAKPLREPSHHFKWCGNASLTLSFTPVGVVHVAAVTAAFLWPMCGKAVTLRQNGGEWQNVLKKQPDFTSKRLRKWVR